MDSKKIKIAALQMSSVVGDRYANYKKVEEIIAKDSLVDSDVLILPEVWTVGWSCEDFDKCAEPVDNSETIEFLSEISKKNHINILGGSFIQKMPEGKSLNTCPVFNRHGELIATYSKNHLYSYCGCTEGDYVKVGESPVMVDIEGVKIGLTICYDIRFPEIFSAYRKCGADMLVNMAAWGSKKPLVWETLTRARAIENQCYMVALTQSGQIKGDEWNIGHSRIIDYLGETVAEIKDQKEGICFAEIDFANMYEYRKKCTILRDIRESYEVKCI